MLDNIHYGLNRFFLYFQERRLRREYLLKNSSSYSDIDSFLELIQDTIKLEERMGKGLSKKLTDAITLGKALKGRVGE